MPPSFAFDAASQRFRYTSGDRAGQFVSQAKIKGIFTQSARVTDADVQTANEQWKAERDGDEFQNILEAKPK